MNRTEENAPTVTIIAAESLNEVHSGSSPNGKTPFVPQRQKSHPSLRDGGRLLFIGAGIVLVLLLFAFSGISHRSSPTQKRSARLSQTNNSGQTEEINPSISITPILDAGRSSEQNADNTLVDPNELGRFRNKQPNQLVARSLGDVPSFGKSQSWQPAPYQPGLEPAPTSDTQAEPAQPNNNREAADKASLVFVRSNTSSATQKSQEAVSQVDLGVGLPPGTRLRARLESAISTVVHTPVVAVIQYNYEQHGQILVPAGAKALGHLEAADRSGYLEVRFESLEMPDGSSLGVDAAATDLQLRPLRGKVEGRNANKSFLVRSFAGVGEIAATLVGRGSLNQPLSEDDLLRERLTNNIGQASDQSVANLALTEHLLVSLPADTEIYVVLQKSAKKSAVQSPPTRSPLQTSNQPNIEELRQLLQLQRELSEATEAKPLQ